MIRVRGQKILESIIILMDLILGSLMIGCKLGVYFIYLLKKTFSGDHQRYGGKVVSQEHHFNLLYVDMSNAFTNHK